MREFEGCYKDLIDHTKDGPFMQYAHVVDTGEHAERIADHYGIRDYVNTVSTACSSASNAIILGAELIKYGKLDRVICGGSDVLSRFTLNGFNSLMILDKGHTKPFDANRSGVNLGEGAAYIILESKEMLNKYPKKIHAELTGYSNSNDAYHQTASSPDGDGALLSMQRAMNMAGLKTSDIDYINCHGTATENNDLSEALAIQNLFGSHVPLFASTKPYTGHTLAAAGSVEAIFSILSINHEVAFPNLNFENQMPEIMITPLRDLIQNISIKNILSNSFGFGGSNTSLLFSKVDQTE
jgi:3-oxoacyl-[acyl-carrier-protein] synthase-1